MHFQLLAELDFPPEVIVFVIAAVFSALKWLFEKFTKRNQEEDQYDPNEELYEEYREQIRQRQTQLQTAPPPLPEDPKPQPIAQQPAPAASAPPQARYSLEDIERARAAKLASTNKQSTPTAPKTVSSSRKPHPLREALQTKSALRKAIVLREVLGPPKALKD